MIGLVNKLQQICTSLGDNALSPQSILWNKLPTIVVVGGQVLNIDSGCSSGSSWEQLGARVLHRLHVFSSSLNKAWRL